MAIYFKNYILLLIVFLAIGCEEKSIQPSIACQSNDNISVNINHPKAATIQAKLEEYIAKGIPGVSVLVSDDDGIYRVSAGYADLENNITMQPCHINKLGSVTKMMMGALVWQYIQDGKLGINDKMSLHLPDLTQRITNGNEITVAMLLNHTSGIYDISRDLGYNLAVVNDFSKSWTSEEILNYIEDKPATNLPGELVSYSNSNTLILGMILEKITGRQHGDLLKEKIFDPLGMRSTVYYDYSDDFPYNTLAQGYLDLNNDGGAIQNISQLNPGSGNGYTGVYSTVTDMYVFMNALMRDKTLTTPENLDLIFDSMRLNQRGSWKSSIGGIHDEYRKIFEEDMHAYGHAGGDIGYSANLSYLPHNNTIFAATYNYGVNLPSALGEEVWSLMEELMVIMAE